MSLCHIHLPLLLVFLISGEWRNMQEVIRKTFRLTFSQIEKQQEQIDKLLHVTSALKEALVTKIGEKEVNQLIATNELAARRSTNDELAFMSHQISDVKAELERKASVRYVDDGMRRKVDKSDILMRTSHQFSNIPQTTTIAADISKLSNQMGRLTIMQENLDKTLVDQQEKIKAAASISEISGIQNQLNQLYSLVQHFPQREEVAKLYEKKVDKRELEKIMAHKADKALVESSLAGFERLSAEQEKSITQIRLRLENHCVESGGDFNPISAQGRVHDESVTKYSNERFSVSGSPEVDSIVKGKRSICCF